MILCRASTASSLGVPWKMHPRTQVATQSARVVIGFIVHPCEATLLHDAHLEYYGCCASDHGALDGG